MLFLLRFLSLLAEECVECIYCALLDYTHRPRTVKDDDDV